MFIKTTHGTWKDFNVYMSNIDSLLKADDPKFNGTALVIHREGILLQDGATVEVHEICDDVNRELVLVVFGEHMRATHFDMDQVTAWSNLELHHPADCR